MLTLCILALVIASVAIGYTIYQSHTFSKERTAFNEERKQWAYELAGRPYPAKSEGSVKPRARVLALNDDKAYVAAMEEPSVNGDA